MKEENSKVESSKKSSSKLGRWLWSIFLFFFFFFFILSTILYLPPVQNLVVDVLSNKFSKQVNGKIEVGTVRLNLVKGFVLKDVHIIDEAINDTLLFANQINSDFKDNLLSLFQKRLILNTIELKGIHLVDQKSPENLKSQLAYLLEKTEIKETKDNNRSRGVGSGFIFDIEKVILHDIYYQYNDPVKGQELMAELKDAEIEIEYIGLDSGSIIISDFFANEPRFQVNIIEPVLIETQNTPEEQLTINENIETIPKVFEVIIRNAKLKEGRFRLLNFLKEPSTDLLAFDPADVHFKEMNNSFKNLRITSEGIMTGKLEETSLITNDEMFTLKDMSCDSIRISPRRMEFLGLLAHSKRSELSDNLVFKYRDFESFGDFNDKVILEATLKKSKLSVPDLQYFAPSLKENQFFNDNKNKNFRITGTVFGRINALNGNDMQIYFGDQIKILGRMNSRNITDPENALVNADFEELEVSIFTLHDMIPRFDPPENFYKLGQLVFNGRFDGYFEDFVAFGALSSDLGDLDLDMRLDIKYGAENANYSGRATLLDFDLARWTDNDQFGTLVASAQVREGQGLTLETANAILNANVDIFEFKDYQYRDFNMDGKLERNLFDGVFQIQDPNIDMVFNGTIDFKDTIPTYDFIADINALKLVPLQLSSKDYGFHGSFSINGRGTDLDNIEGQASGNNFVINNEGKDLQIDSFYINMSGSFPQSRNIILNSSLVDAELNGVFRLDELPDAFISGLKTNYPSFTRDVKSIKFEKPTEGYDFSLNMLVHDTKDALKTLIGKDIRFSDARILGRISEKSRRSALDISLPNLKMDEHEFQDIKIDLFALNDQAELNVTSGIGNISNIELKPLEISATIDNDKLNFAAFTEELLDSFRNIQLQGILSTNASDYKIKLKESGFDAFGGNWRFNQNNNILFGKQKIVIDNVNISDGNHTLYLEDIDNKGIAVLIKRLNADFIERIMGWDNADLRGFISGNFALENIFDFTGIDADLNIPAFGFNKHEFGNINFQAISQDADDPLAYELRAIDNDKNLNLKGAYFIEEKNNFAELIVNKYPLNLLEYILSDGISGTVGTVSGRLSVKGPIAYPELLGTLIGESAGTKVDYLGTRYRLGDNKIHFKEGFIDMSEALLLDSQGNTARIIGGLRHNAFRDFAADLQILSPQFIGLNTTKAQNPTYYGFAKGDLDVSFEGPFDNLNIIVNATTGRNTQLSIPVEYTSEEISTSFIEIINRDVDNQQKGYTPPKLSGLKLDMNLNVTEDSKVTIIFDEAANDKLESTGRGAIQLNIDQEGNFAMLGDYEVVSGQYLFTIPSLFVNKSFILQNGGKIQWTGDPLNAKLDIRAEYKGLQASLETFLQEYIALGNERLNNQAKNKTDVSLAMDLRGTLTKPEIDFEISFPNLTGELKPLAESKLRTLQASPDSYNDQVFGLILLRNFLPSDNPLANNFLRADNITSNIFSTGFSTISEFLSNQTSILLSSIFAEALGDNTFLTGIDVDINASKYRLSGDATPLPDEYDFSLNSSFNNDKWRVQVGGKYVRINTLLSDNPYFAPDMVVEYFITEDRRLKLNFYTRYDLDATQYWKLQSGLGLSYRNEFNSIFDFANFLKKETGEDLE